MVCFSLRYNCPILSKDKKCSKFFFLEHPLPHHLPSVGFQPRLSAMTNIASLWIVAKEHNVRFYNLELASNA